MRFFVTNRHNGKRYPAEGQHWPEHGWSVKVFDFNPGTWGRATTGVGVGPVIDQGFQKDMEQRGWVLPELKPEPDVRRQEMDRLAKSLGGQAAPPAQESRRARAKAVVEALLEYGMPVRCNHCGARGRYGQEDTPCLACGKGVFWYSAPGIGYGKKMAAVKPAAPEPQPGKHYPFMQEHCGHCDTPTPVTLKPQDIDLDKISDEEKRMGTKVEKEHVVKAKDAIAVAAGHWAEDPKYYQHGRDKGCFPELPAKAKAYLAGIDSLGL